MLGRIAGFQRLARIAIEVKCWRTFLFNVKQLVNGSGFGAVSA
jgi:hypothetical protein